MLRLESECGNETTIKDFKQFFSVDPDIVVQSTMIIPYVQTAYTRVSVRLADFPHCMLYWVWND